MGVIFIFLKEYFVIAKQPPKDEISAEQLRQENPKNIRKNIEKKSKKIIEEINKVIRIANSRGQVRVIIKNKDKITGCINKNVYDVANGIIDSLRDYYTRRGFDIKFTMLNSFMVEKIEIRWDE